MMRIEPNKPRKIMQSMNELSANWAAWIQRQTMPLRLSCFARDGFPAILSLWYIYEDGKLYCATQLSAKVAQYLRNDPRCAFEISTNEPPYIGVRGRGLAILQIDNAPEILERLILRYLGDLESPLPKRLLAKSDTEVAIIIRPNQWWTWDFSQRMRGSY